MAGKYSLYTVRGAREAYFAAVDWATGRVWTAPNRDGAIQQATAAGLDTFDEQTIGKDEFLRALDVGGDRKIRGADENRKKNTPRKEKGSLNAASPKDSVPTDALGAWFASPAGAAVEPHGKKTFANQRPARTAKKSKRNQKKRGNSSPFSGNQPIAAEREDVGAGADDVLVFPAPAKSSNQRTPFSGAAPIDPPSAPDRE